MKVRKYRATTTKEAFAQARKELGDEAVLLHQRTLRGDPRLGGDSLVEITVAVDLTASDASLPTGATSTPALDNLPRQEDVDLMRSRGYTAATVRPFFPTGSQASAYGAPAEFSRRPAAARTERTASPGDDYEALWRELRTIRALLHRQQGHRQLNQSLIIWKAALQETMLPAELVDDLLLGLEEMLTPSALQQPEMVTGALFQRLSAGMRPPSGAIQPGYPGAPLVYVLVGPTGVGKTTTLAKLAARYSVQHRLPVAMITADTFRVGAVSQLRTYSDLIHAPLDVAYTPDELTQQVAKHQDKAIIFVDTPGRSPNDTEQLSVMRSFVQAIPRAHLQIALAAGTLPADARRIIERFAVVEPSGLLLTKLDETTLYGPACGLMIEIGLPVSYFTVGQRVPEDIEVASRERLLERLMHQVHLRLDRQQDVLSTLVPSASGFSAGMQPLDQRST